MVDPGGQFSGQVSPDRPPGFVFLDRDEPQDAPISVLLNRQALLDDT